MNGTTTEATFYELTSRIERSTRFAALRQAHDIGPDFDPLPPFRRQPRPRPLFETVEAHASGLRLAA